MSTTTELSNEDLQTVLGLIRDADSVELKLTIHESARADAARSLGVDPLDSQIRQVFFFDTPELALNTAGVVVRARRRQNEQGDTVVKLRPVVPNELAEDLRASKSFNVEVDAMPGGFVCSASFKGVAGNTAIREAAAGGRPLRKLFSKEQRAFYATHAPDGIELDTLSVLGPIPVIKVKVEPEGFGRRLVGELWMYPDGSQIVELSTKARPDPDHQGEGRAGGLRAPTGRRAVDVPRRIPDRRAVDQGSARRGVPGRGGGQGVPACTWDRPDGGAADEDEDSARVLLECVAARVEVTEGRTR